MLALREAEAGGLLQVQGQPGLELKEQVIKSDLSRLKKKKKSEQTSESESVNSHEALWQCLNLQSVTLLLEWKQCLLVEMTWQDLCTH